MEVDDEHTGMRAKCPVCQQVRVLGGPKIPGSQSDQAFWRALPTVHSTQAPIVHFLHAMLLLESML